MKNLILLITCIVIFSCKKNTENSKEVTKSEIIENTNSIILNKNSVIFISPSSNKLEAMKKKMGKDFFTIADDANFYSANATQFLDSIKVKYSNEDETKIFSFTDKNNNLVQIKNSDKENSWYAILYNNDSKEYRIVDILMFSEDFKKFYNKNESPDSSARTLEDFNLEKQKKYSIIKEIKCDLNQDNIADKILVYKNNKEFKSDDDTTKPSPVVVFLGVGNDRFQKFENPNIFPNDSNDFFKNVVIKDNFFTVELNNEVPDKYVIDKYITFKYDKLSKSIVLFKYGQNLFGDKNETLLYTSKNFGTISFEQYDSNTIFEKVGK
ncbi:hypothetical protein NTJ12_002260 [Flavobacterium psychrophilum]|nr:hypothetical protein [Flavobacterium psychrophilum]